jgi:hypothetical protein
MFRGMGTKDVPRVACSGLMDGNVTDWCQSMSGFSGVVFPGLRLVEGIVTSSAPKLTRIRS